MQQSPLYATVDFDRPGKQLGYIGVPYSHNLGGWANLRMPVAVVANGTGRTALVMAGNHGDEYPGPIAILKLMGACSSPSRWRGRVILLAGAQRDGGAGGDAAVAVGRQEPEPLLPRPTRRHPHRAGRPLRQ